MDTEHWFAPMKRKADNSGKMMELYLSSNQNTPFYVKIEHKQKVIDSVLVSKGKPIRYDIQDLELMETDKNDSVNVVLNKGLHIFGDQKFFANIRFSQTNHAEIITSKGRAGKGTHFFIGYAPFKNNMVPNYTIVGNYTVGVIATENNTTVNINGKAIQLHKGQSYLIEGLPMDNSYIGKEITADKPISVTNGNYNGQYASTDPDDGSDILMDQAIPVERLGKEFILMSGNGKFTDGMESALIIATEDNTEIYFNTETTPSATLSKGQYYMMPSAKYKFVNSKSSTAYIKTTKNAYVYQLLSGSGSVAAGGFNYIPPLNCYLPRNIDEIGFINENPSYLYNNFYQTHPTKLNIITQAGAVVKYNGTTLNGINGPYLVSGTTEWITFSVPNVTGNAVIESTKAVTAGIAAGDDAVGYGGYFAGASSLPIITKSGICFPGIKLEVDDTYDDYQWKKKNPATGLFEDIPGANTYTYIPQTVGEYLCEIGSISCGIMETPSYIVLPCSILSQESIDACKTATVPIHLTINGKPINPAKTKIVKQPTKGNVIISGNSIIYTPNAGFSNNDTDVFSYYIEDSTIYPESEIVTVKVTLKKYTFQNASLTSCLINGNATYDLSSASITSESGVVINYYTNLANAQNNDPATAISNFTSYATPLTKIYANVTFPLGCSEIAEITLNHFPLSNVDTSKYNGMLCDDNIDGSETVRFSDITPLIVTNPSDFQVEYYTSSGTGPLPNEFTFYGSTTVKVEVKSKNGCPSAFGTILFGFKDKITLNNVPSQKICDNNLDGVENINISDYTSLFTSSASVAYYDSFANAQTKKSPISSSQNINGNRSYWLRFENTSDCPNIGELKIDFRQPKKSQNLKDILICPENTVNLDAGAGFESYLWSNGSTSSSSGPVKPGSYYVDLGYEGCIYRQNVTVSPAPTVLIKSVDVKEKAITVNATNGTPPYQYSLDGINWQESNVFTNLNYGIQTVFVKDYYNCTPQQKKFLIVRLINVITPNADGYNDVMDYSDLNIKKDVSIQVYDRYGKLIHNAKAPDYKWNGTQNGRPIPTGTYWYLLKWIEPDTNLQVEYHGWILVKNRE